MPDYNRAYSTPYHNRDITGCSFLITGGAGFIGSNIVEYLLKHGAQRVRVLDNFSTGFKDNIIPFLHHPSFELMQGDIRDMEACKKAVEGIGYVSHQAALGSVPRSIADPVTTHSVNISGFLNVLTAARDAQVKRLVYASSSSVYGDNTNVHKQEQHTGNPLSPYAITKLVNELYAGIFSKTYNFHSVGLRYFNVFGPRQQPTGPYAAVVPVFMEAALNGYAAYINGDGEISRDFTFVENAVQANIKAMLAENIARAEVVNIAFGERTTLNQLWAMITKTAGVNIEPAYRDERQGDINNSLADIQQAGKLLGYQPLFSVSEGVKITMKWFKRFTI